MYIIAPNKSLNITFIFNSHLINKHGF